MGGSGTFDEGCRRRWVIGRRGEAGATDFDTFRSCFAFHLICQYSAGLIDCCRIVAGSGGSLAGSFALP